MDLDSFLAKLEDDRPAGNGYVAICPSHDDREASLGVTEADGKILVTCHAGCTTADVLDAMNLQFSDLYTNARTYDEPEAIYSYVDEQGLELFQAVRFPGKKFRQRAKGPEGDWVWSLDGVRRVLYRLPEVLEAIQANRKVIVVEGEKDANALWDAGYVATCNPMGAGKWRDEFSDMLAGAHVVVWADKDDPGRAHAEAVRKSLHGKAAEVSIVQSKEGKDAFDHLLAGLTPEDTVPQDFGVVFKRASSIKAEPVEFLDLDRRIPLAGITTCQGFPGVGKSTLACWYAALVTSSGRGVIVVAGEDPHGSVWKPRLAAAGANLDLVGFLSHYRSDNLDTRLYLPTDIPQIEQAADENDVLLIIIDPLMAHLSEEIEENSNQSIRRALAPLTDVAVRQKLAVLGLHHLNKSRESNAMLRGGGSLAGIMGQIRSGLEATETMQGQLQLTQFKSSWGQKAPSLNLVTKSAQVVLDGVLIDTSRIEPLPAFFPHSMLEAV